MRSSLKPGGGPLPFGWSTPHSLCEGSHGFFVGSCRRLVSERGLWSAQLSSWPWWWFSHQVVSNSWPCGLQSARLLCPWGSPGKNTGVGCHFLHQGIFPSQGWSLGLLHGRQILSCLSHQGSPYTLNKSNIKKLNIYRHIWNMKDPHFPNFNSER